MIIIKNLQKKIPIYPKRIKKTILKVLSSETLKSHGDITVCFLSDRKIRTLNNKFHHTDASTDVLCFNNSDKNGPLCADIVISADTAKRNAKIYKTSTAFELNLYVVHGILHLLGYSDSNKKETMLMRKKETCYVH